MRAPALKLVPSVPDPRSAIDPRGLSGALESATGLSPQVLDRVLGPRMRSGVSLGDRLVAHGLLSPEDVLAAQEKCFGAERVDLRRAPPDPRLIRQIGAARCLREGLVPWKTIGGATVVATSAPERMDQFRMTAPADFGPILMALAPRREVELALTRAVGPELAQAAETRVPEHESCRRLGRPGLKTGMALLLLAVILAAVIAPVATYSALLVWSVLTLILNTLLKAAAGLLILTGLGKPRAGDRGGEVVLAAWPVVSVIVPLYHEREIATNLIARLQMLDYPRELLDICLVVEGDDIQTRATIAGTLLPPWIRTITVPHGTLKTKPRALNYALDFCRGTIVGVYDAEDKPEPGQIRKVVECFHQRGPEVACLQGALDFYNTRTNWISRCFTIEYATWFRVILPGLERLGFPIPLGGTTLFFRRAVLEELGGWDAHNVTEDADLGIRLARHGYRTELIDTVTQEEANCHTWPWVKQRSRWLKGYAVTWAVHMRNPARLWRELGAWKFLGVQILFIGALSQFVLAPILWAFWLLLLGLPHPLLGVMPDAGLIALGVLFFSAELIGVFVGALALSKAGRRNLMGWVPTTMLYMPLGTLAAYRGLWEIAARPFYWDKTAHGLFDPEQG